MLSPLHPQQLLLLTCALAPGPLGPRDASRSAPPTHTGGPWSRGWTGRRWAGGSGGPSGEVSAFVRGRGSRGAGVALCGLRAAQGLGCEDRCWGREGPWAWGSHRGKGAADGEQGLPFWGPGRKRRQEVKGGLCLDWGVGVGEPCRDPQGTVTSPGFLSRPCGRPVGQGCLRLLLKLTLLTAGGSLVTCCNKL